MQSFRSGAGAGSTGPGFDAQMAAIGLLDIERAGLAHQIAELAETISARIEIGKQL